jgi:hypothetical protein
MKYAIAVLGLVTAAVAGSLLLAPRPACGQSGCGLKPLKPLPPLGCKDLVAECRCDSDGRNCRWEWVCVPR